jgi:hypothetical protein
VAQERGARRRAIRQGTIVSIPPVRSPIWHAGGTHERRRGCEEPPTARIVDAGSSRRRTRYLRSFQSWPVRSPTAWRPGTYGVVNGHHAQVFRGLELHAVAPALGKSFQDPAALRGDQRTVGPRPPRLFRAECRYRPGPRAGALSPFARYGTTWTAPNIVVGWKLHWKPNVPAAVNVTPMAPPSVSVLCEGMGVGVSPP